MKTAKACARLRRQLQRVSSGKRAGNCRSISPARRPRRRIVRASERPRLSVRLVLFGLEGTISAKGSSYAGAMPPWPQLTDGEIAAALDYVLSAWGNDKLLPRDFTLILPSDVAAARGQQMSAVDVHALRGRIVTTTPGGVADQATTALTFTAAQAERGHAIYERNCQDCHGTTLDIRRRAAQGLLFPAALGQRQRGRAVRQDEIDDAARPAGATQRAVVCGSDRLSVEPERLHPRHRRAPLRPRYPAEDELEEIATCHA